ncbi:MAG: hypothetical protein ABS76_21445 [Pelagibacterium sp. SCN 64-44]|jgi:integrase|nr:MAG: hypothetical protein ABS76_21445 [Pelagibacterium sp. SCN 64-44]
MPTTITATTIAKAKADSGPGCRRHDIVDAKSRGLSLRVSATGVQWSLRYQMGGKDKRLALGDVDLWTIAEARSIVDRAQQMLRDKMGVPDEPWLDRMRAAMGKAEAVTMAAPDPAPRQVFAWTFAEGRKAFLAEVKRTRREDTWKDYGWKLQGDDLKHLDGTALPLITRQQLAGILGDIHRSGRETHAQNTQRVLSRFWNWLAEDGQIAKSGVQPGILHGLKAPEPSLVEDDADPEDPFGPGYVPPMREIGRIVAISRSGAVHDTVAAALELMCWVVQRRRTIVEARRQDFEFLGAERGGLWHIPPRSMKSRSKKAKRRPHTIPLPPAAWSVVQRMLDVETESPWLFPQIRARRAGEELTHINPSTLTHMLGWLPGVNASPHDVRRAFATHGETTLGLLRTDTAAILDHNPDARDVTGAHYALHNGTHRTWPIMTAWTDAVEAEIGGAVAKLESAAEIKAAVTEARKNGGGKVLLAAE